MEFVRVFLLPAASFDFPRPPRGFKDFVRVFLKYCVLLRMAHSQPWMSVDRAGDYSEGFLVVKLPGKLINWPN